MDATEKQKISTCACACRKTMGGRVTYTPSFVNYDIWLKDRLLLWSCWNNLQIAVYTILGNTMEMTLNVSFICNSLALKFDNRSIFLIFLCIFETLKMMIEYMVTVKCISSYNFHSVVLKINSSSIRYKHYMSRFYFAIFEVFFFSEIFVIFWWILILKKRKV